MTDIPRGTDADTLARFANFREKAGHYNPDVLREIEHEILFKVGNASGIFHLFAMVAGEHRHPMVFHRKREANPDYKPGGAEAPRVTRVYLLRGWHAITQELERNQSGRYALAQMRQAWLDHWDWVDANQ